MVTRTATSALYVMVLGPAAKKGVPRITHVSETVTVSGSVAQPLAIAERVRVYGVGVRRSPRFAKVH
jgi:hypothetical protein